MPHSETTQFRFSLRNMFAAITLVGIEIWLMQQGPAWFFFAPLCVAIALEVSGNRSAAQKVAIATLFFWIGFPCFYAILASIYGHG